MLDILAQISIKDYFILLTSVILVLCIFKIRELKRTISQEVHKRLLPQLTLKLVLDLDNIDSGLYLKNESFFLAQDIKIEDVQVTLDDYGFKNDLILVFENIDRLQSKEETGLKFKVFDKNKFFLSEVTEKIMPHLIVPNFKVKINYCNIESLRFRVTFSKKRDKFFTEGIDYLF